MPCTHAPCTVVSEVGGKASGKKGKKVIGMLDKLTIWPVTTKDGKQKKHVPGSRDGSNLLSRLKRLWDFVVSVAHALEYAEPSFVTPPLCLLM